MISGELNMSCVIVDLLLAASCLSLARAGLVLLARVIGLFRNTVAMVFPSGRWRSRYSVSDTRFLQQMHIRLRSTW